MLSIRSVSLYGRPGVRLLHVSCSKGFDPNPKPPKKPKKIEVEEEEEVVEIKSAGVSSREVPSYVANRVLTRIAVFSGVPVFIGILTLPVFYYLKVAKEIDVAPWVVYLTQIFTFGGGVLGISYAILSSSAGDQQDFIGFDTFRANLRDIMGR